MKSLKAFLRVLLFSLLSTGTIHVLSACSSDNEPTEEVIPIPLVDAVENEYELDWDAEEFSVAVKTNQAHLIVEIYNSGVAPGEKYSTPCTWISRADTRADLSNVSYHFRIEANDGSKDRKASILFTVDSQRYHSATSVSVLQKGRSE